jgi:hypothetical protein
MEITDIKYDALLNFIDTGATGELSAEMVQYLETLELIRSMHMRYEDRSTIIRFLQKHPYNLSPYLATKYYSDAAMFFYLNIPIKKQAWRNMYAEELDRAADLVIKTATSSKDIDIYKNIKLAASDMRQLGVPENEDIPEEFFKKPYKLYVLNPNQVGRVSANRNLLARHIDSLDIPEADKQRVKSDAMIEDIDFLSDIEDDEDKS